VRNQRMSMKDLLTAWTVGTVAIVAASATYTARARTSFDAPRGRCGGPL
jgi:hypothetical protein